MNDFDSDLETIRDRARADGSPPTIPTTRVMLEGILAVEEEHANDLASILDTMG